MRFLRVLPGFGLYGLCAYLAFAYIGGHWESLLSPAQIFATLVLPISVLIGAYGVGGTWRRFRSLLSEEQRVRHGFTPGEIGRAVDLHIATTYGAAALVTVFQVIRASRLLIYHSGIGSSEGIPVAGEIIAVGIGTFFWAVLLCEGLFRPLRHRLDSETRTSGVERAAPGLLFRILPGLILFGVFGFLIAWFLAVVIDYGPAGAHLAPSLFFLDPSILFSALILPLFPLAAAYGFRGAGRWLVALVLGHRPTEGAEALSLWIASLYGTALLSTVGGLIVLGGFLSGSGEVIGEKLRWSVGVLLWTIPLAEGILRPLKHRLADREK